MASLERLECVAALDSAAINKKWVAAALLRWPPAPRLGHLYHSHLGEHITCPNRALLRVKEVPLVITWTTGTNQGCCIQQGHATSLSLASSFFVPLYLGFVS